METLTLLTAQVNETVCEIADDKVKEEIIFEHIKAAEKLNFIIDEFPPNLDWFNTSQPLSSYHLEGKIVVIDFFTYCCINCLHILPFLRQLEENFSVADGLVVLGVHTAKFDNEKDSKNVLQAVKKLNITHPVINDRDGYLWNKLGISCWPTILILGPKRQSIFSLVGEGNKDQLLFFVKIALKYYKNSISSQSLPLLICDQILTSSLLSFPGKITNYGNLFAVSDSGNNRILIFDKEGFIKFQVGGKAPGFKDGSFEAARFNSPQGLVFYDDKTVYVADTENHAIRLIDLAALKVKTVVGTGQQGVDIKGGKNGIEQEISSPWDLCIIPCADIEDSEIKSLVQFDELSFNRPLTCSLSGLPPFPPPPPPPPPPLINSLSSPLPPLPPINSPPCPLLSPVSVLAGSNVSDGSSNSISKNAKTDQNISSSKILIIAAAGTHQIWAYFMDSSVCWKGQNFKKETCSAIAGSGKEENRNNSYPMRASFAQPSGLTYSPQIKAIFIADSESSTIRKMSLKDKSVSHVIGGTKSPDDLFSYGDADGKGYNAKLQHPLGVAWSKKENSVFICDTYNHKIKKINISDGHCKTIHRTPNLYSEPGGCCLNETEDTLFVTDTNNNCIKVVNLLNGSVEKFDLSERANSTIENLSKESWEVETSLHNSGGQLTVRVTFEPKEVHGKWKRLSANNNIEAEPSNGQFDGNICEPKFNFLPGKNDTTLEILFEVILCGSNTCVLKKVILKVNVKRAENAEKTVTLDLKRSLAS